MPRNEIGTLDMRVPIFYYGSRSGMLPNRVFDVITERRSV